jgi:hypothetical protein
MLTVALHVLLLSPALPGVSGAGSGERGPAKLAGPPLSWFEIAAPAAPAALAPQPNVRLQPLKVQSVDLELARDVDVPAMPDASASEYVRRMAALTARIQGLWKLPHTRLTADFHCRARLRPDESGSVEEVELEGCDDSGPVRASIAQAIEHAMPLPLPQERAGAAADIVLQFIAYAGPNGSSHTSIEPAAN